MGCVYRRGNTLWIKYYRRGRPYAESARTDSMEKAQQLLKLREGEIAQGKLPGVIFDRVRFDELAESLLREYRVNGRKSLDRAQLSVDHLTSYFAGYRVPEITSQEIDRYKEYRMGQKAANGTINRELAALRRMLTLGQRSGKVSMIPYVSKLKENNVRKGFFEHGDFLALRDALPDHLKGYMTFAYRSGWRKKEIINLKWTAVDLHQGIVRLEPGETKNDAGREIYLDAELVEVFTRQWEKHKAAGRITPYVFPNQNGTGRISDYRSAWHTACKKAGIGYRIPHDFRRTAVRNQIRAGVPDVVAMQVSGHKTRSVFMRYNIVSAEDLKEAAARQAEYLQKQPVTKTVTILQFNPKSASK